MHITILVTHKFKIEDRRRRVATLLAQSMTETEIAQELKVDQSTISRDIKVLKQLWELKEIAEKYDWIEKIVILYFGDSDIVYRNELPN